MKLSFKVINITFLFIFSFGCSQHQKKEDIIPPINLISGIADSIVFTDLFYTELMNITLKPNSNLSAEYNDNKIYIKTDSSFEGMTLLDFEIDMQSYSIPVVSKKLNFYEFSFYPSKSYNKLTLFGSFNGWDRTNIPMRDEDGDGVFTVKIPLEPGSYQYKFFGDGEEIVDPVNSEKVSNGMGSFNSIRTIEDKNNQKFYLHIDGHYSKNPQSTLSFYLEDETEGELTKENIFALLDNEKIDKDKIDINGKFIGINFNYDELENQTFRVAISKSGRVSNIQTIKLENGKPLSNSAFRWDDGIIYSLLIDRFNDGNPTNNNPVLHDSLSPKANYMGGDLEGVIAKLNDGYFDSLGINVLWISPVYDNPNEAYKEYPAPHRYYSGYHGYWPISDKTVDEHFGNLDDVKHLVELAHSKGIKVLLDFVSNHVHREHPYFKNHREWFGQLELPDGRLNLRFWDEFRLTTWFEPYLPSFDYLGSEEALETMTDLAVWWLKETGADGYRHDAVKHVPNKFWRRLNDKIRKEVTAERKLDVYQIGETFGSYDLISSYVNNGQLSSQFNFNLYDVALPTFIRKDASFASLDKEMHKTFSIYGVNHVMGNIMDSHDKNRFMAFADGDLDASEWSAIEKGWNDPPKVDDPQNYKKLILYMAYMNSIPGLPVIYYGSEFGMSGASDPDNRRMMRFNQDLNNDEKNTLSSVKVIINLRKEHSALRHGDFYTLHADDNVYSYIRSDMNERVLVVLNKSKETQNIKIVIPASYEITMIEDLISNETYKYSNNISLDIRKMDYRIFKLY